MNAAQNIFNLTKPKVIEDLTFEEILARKKAKFISLNPAVTAILNLESEALTQDLEVASYDELLLRERINNAALATMLAFATGSDLDAQAANWNVKRLVVKAEDLSTQPPTPAEYEADDRLRLRVVQAMEAHTTAGSVGSYIYHALSASAKIKDVSISAPTFKYEKPLAGAAFCARVVDSAGLDKPMPGDVAITILSDELDGSSNAELDKLVLEKLNAESVRPLTDNPRLRPASIIKYSVDADLVFYPDAKSELAMQVAKQNINDFVKAQHKLGHDINLSGIYAALHVDGVQQVKLNAPLKNLVINNQQAAFCESINIKAGGFDV